MVAARLGFRINWTMPSCIAAQLVTWILHTSITVVDSFRHSLHGGPTAGPVVVGGAEMRGRVLELVDSMVCTVCCRRLLPRFLTCEWTRTWTLRADYCVSVAIIFFCPFLLFPFFRLVPHLFLFCGWRYLIYSFWLDFIRLPDFFVFSSSFWFSCSF